VSGDVRAAEGDLSADKVGAALGTQCLGRQYVFLPSCGSTSDEVARRAVLGAQEGLLIATDAQTKGRGRRGRAWHSPPGENLYFSLLLRPRLPPHRVVPVTLVAGATLAQALGALGFSPRLKWPNDVLLAGPGGLRKVAGILAEMSTEGSQVRHMVLGIGVNVNIRSFPAELAGQAVSLAMTRGGPVDRLRVMAEIVNRFEPSYLELVTAGPTTALASWRQFGLFGQPCWVQVEGRRVEAFAEGVDEGGALIARTTDGARVPIHAGEIDWRKTE
jgi:BirA family biotin operon repressor/biotin-[acetyl-CoA-carboxylase] ligase